MSTTSKYFVTSTVSGQNWFDFDLSIEQLTLAGQDFIFTGSNTVDAVRIGPGVIFDFTKSNGGKDNLFLSGRLADYTLTPATSTLTLERGAGATYEKVVVAKGTSTNFDNVIFADGTASTFDLHAKASGTLPVLTLGTSLSAPTTLSATIKAFALDAAGEVFAPSAKGMNYILTGSNAVDMVYVNPGATIDATKLNGGVDEIYFTGNWADYVKEVFTSKLVFTNAVTGDNVTVAAGAGASNDRLVFADGSVQTSNARTALTGNLSAAISSVTGVDVSKTTPGLAPKISSLVDGVTNLDVTSPIVLKASQSVMPVAGKFIRLVNDGGAGFRGEAGNQDQIIEVTSSAVTVSGNLIIFRPTVDLDLANSYHVEIDAGAFVNAQSRGNAAVTDAAAINFSTVTPGSGLLGVAAAVQSQSMSIATGALQNSYRWLDIEGVGSPSSSTATTVDLAGGDIALVFKDYDPAPGSVSLATDGIGAPDFYVRATGFAAGDLLYADNQAPSQANLLSQSQVLADTPAAGVTTVSFGTGTGGLGGVVEITLAGSAGTFGTVDELRTLLGLSQAPIGESGTSSGGVPFAIQSLTSPDTVTEGTSASYNVTLSAAAPAGGFVVDWRVLPGATDPAQPQDFGSGTLTTFPSGSITIAAGTTTGQITVPVFDDALTEVAERFVLQVGQGGAGSGFTTAFEHWTVIEASDAGGGGADATPPVLTISSGASKFLAGDVADVQFQFSEPVTGFDRGDVVVSGGVLEYFSGSGASYYAGFRPNNGFDGASTFTVAAGAFSDVSGNASTVAATLSVPTFTIQPGNSGGASFTTPASGTSDILIRFSEPISEAAVGQAISGFALALNADAGNGFQGAVPSPEITGYTLGESSTANGYTGYSLLTLHTNTLLGSADVVRVGIDGFGNSFRDKDGNRLAAQQIHIGGNGPNTIDLDGYWSSSRQILRGNGGDDTLVGTGNADSFIDGGGADFIDPLSGGDSISLIENGLTGTGGLAYARDAILIGLGDSRRGVGNIDVIRFDPAQSASGFDWFSSNDANHDALLLESGLIADASSFVAAPASQGSITGHSIAGGVVTFLSGTSTVAITQATNLGDVLDYLRSNLRAPGHTVAFKADDDNNGVAESLFVYQDMGTLPLAGNAEMPDIVVRIEQPAATAAARLASVRLGNAPGANVLEIQDGFAPEPLAIQLAANGVVMNFFEPVYGPAAGASALAMSLQVNGTGTIFKPTAIAGEGSAVVTVQAAGLTMAPTDWALVTYAGTGVADALRDAAGNWLSAQDDEGDLAPPAPHAFALGGEGDNVIDLSSFALPTGVFGMDVEGGGGDDGVIGTSGDDWIFGGRGVDTMTGGSGGDEFGFEQGDSPVVTVDLSAVLANDPKLVGAKYTFPNGKVELITDFGAGDRLYLNPVLDGLTGARWLSAPFSSAGSLDGGSSTGLPDNQSFKVLQGELGADGVFTVGIDYGSGADLLVVYDGDGSDNVSATAFVLQGVTMNDIASPYGGGNVIRSNKPVDNGGGGMVGDTRIDWSQDQNSLIRIAGDDELEFVVHFSDPVKIDTTKGAPQLKITFVDDSGVSHSAFAAFMPYGLPDASGAHVQNSMRFELGLLATDVGRYHVDAFEKNGASIVSLADNLAADVTLDDANSPFTASGYVYPAPLPSMSGTAGNDILAGYLANPAAVPLDGNYAGVTGGAGDRDVLAVPVLLPGALTAEQANGYVLNFDRANMVVQAFAPGSTAAVVTLKVPSTFPVGVERLAYFAVFQTTDSEGGTVYEGADGSPIVLANAVRTYLDAVDDGDVFVFGSLNADTITLTDSAGARQAVRAGPGNDAITGSSGFDAINGDGGNDTIQAGGGDDLVYLSGGTDSVDGGPGFDQVVATLPGQMMNIAGRISGFALQSVTGQWTPAGFEATSTSDVYRILTGDSGGLAIRNFSDGSTAMLASNVEAIQVRQAQSDIRTTIPLILGSADATADTLVGTGSSIVNGRAGDDTLNASNQGNDVLFGGAGNDKLYGGSARDLLYGGSGNDQMYGSGGDDWFVGEGGDDLLVGGDGNDAAGFVVANTGSTPLSVAWDSAANGVLVKQGEVALAKISAGADGVWLVQDLVNTATGFGTDTVSGIEKLTFDFATGSTSNTALTVTSLQIDDLLHPASPWGGVVTQLATSGYVAALPANGLTPNPSVFGVTARTSHVDTTAGTTTFRYDVTLDPSTLPDIDPLLVFIQFGGAWSGVLNASAVSPTWVDSGGQTRPMWIFDTSDLAGFGQVWATANGSSDPALYVQNPLLEPSTGRVATVEVTVSGNFPTAPALTVAGVELYTADWLDAMLASQPPLLVAQVAQAAQVQISALSDDNLLKYAASYDSVHDQTHLVAMFDANPQLNQVEPSELIELTFPGDVSASLVPDSLTFSG